MYKVVLGLFMAVLATIVAAKVTFIANSSVSNAPVNQPWSQDTMELVAWNEDKWVAWIRDGVFEQRPRDKGKWRGHANPSLAYIGWEGTRWQAKIDGEVFLLARRGDWKGPVERVNAIRYRNWKGEKELRTVAQLSR